MKIEAELMPVISIAPCRHSDQRQRPFLSAAAGGERREHAGFVPACDRPTERRYTTKNPHGLPVDSDVRAEHVKPQGRENLVDITATPLRSAETFPTSTFTGTARWAKVDNTTTIPHDGDGAM
jgi:hypothetical protein